MTTRAFLLHTLPLFMYKSNTDVYTFANLFCDISVRFSHSFFNKNGTTTQRKKCMVVHRERHKLATEKASNLLTKQTVKKKRKCTVLSLFLRIGRLMEVNNLRVSRGSHTYLVFFILPLYPEEGDHKRVQIIIFLL